jgi:hypothetical protein
MQKSRMRLIHPYQAWLDEHLDTTEEQRCELLMLAN